MARKKLDFAANPLLSGPSLISRNTSGSPYREISLTEIDPDPEQPRREFDAEALESLSKSISQYGVLCPILIRATTPGGSYRLVSGERRFRAAKKAGLETIPAIIESDTEDLADTRAKQLVENIQRENLNPIERANAIGHLREAYKLSVRDIAGKIGMSKTMVQRSLDILSLDDDLKAALASGASESKILTLKRVEDVAIRKELLSRIEHYTRSQLEEAIETLLGEQLESSEASHGGTGAKKVKPKKKLSAEDRRFVEDVQKNLSLKVQISRKPDSKQQGRVVLDFYSKADLKELYERLTS